MFRLKFIFFIFFLGLGLFAAVPALAGNISFTYRWAWSENIGWIDFYNVTVAATMLTGTASAASIGDISMNCVNTNACAGPAGNWYVSNNGSGALAGWAWSENIGWVSFCGNASGGSTWDGSKWVCPSSPTYRVTIDANGDFSGWAWSANIGWISFNCANTISGCTGAGGNWKVKTTWLTTEAVIKGEVISAIYDSQIAGGVAYNTLRWLGNKPANTTVKFQIASSNLLVSGTGTGAIDSTYRYAWNDFIGWIDFGYSAGNVNVGASQLTGWAYNSNVAEIALDCATSPAGDICISQSNFKVNRDSSTGDLAGWAWNDSIGWISFCGNASGGSTWDGSKWVCPSSPTYQVKINPTTGAFTGWAWNDYVGWISVNCADPGVCGDSDYRVNTAISSALSAFKGPDGSSVTYYQPAPNTWIKIDGPGTGADGCLYGGLPCHNNHRYFRYRVVLESTRSGATPRVDDVQLSWSP